MFSQMKFRSHSPNHGLYRSGQAQHSTAHHRISSKAMQAGMSWIGTWKCSRQKLGTTCRGETHPSGLHVQGCDGSCRIGCSGGFPESIFQFPYKMDKSLYEILWSVESSNLNRWSEWPIPPGLQNCDLSKNKKPWIFPPFHSAVNAWKGEGDWIWFGSRGQVRNKIIRSIKVKMKSSQITEF